MPQTFFAGRTKRHTLFLLLYMFLDNNRSEKSFENMSPAFVTYRTFDLSAWHQTNCVIVRCGILSSLQKMAVAFCPPM